MEYPSFNHHHHNNRYVPHDFPDDHHRNPYPHRLPPPQQSHPPYPSLPPPPPLPPPPYNQPHFTFLNPHPHRSPIDRDSSKSPSFLNRHPPHRQSSPLRFSNRSLYEEDDNHRNRIPPPQQLNFPKFDYRPDPPPRFPPPEPSHRPRLPSPYHPSDPQIRELDLDRISPAFRDDFIDSYASRNNNININSSRISQNRENIIRGGPRNEGHDDGGYRRDNGRSPDRRRFLRDLELGLGSRSPREDFGGNYESRRGEKERSWKLRDEDFQRERSWITRRDEDRRRLLRDTVKDGDFGGSRDEIPSVSGREERNSYEPGKSSNRASEFREEFVQSSSPMKQVQKKSVLLRIGKPNNAIRNRSRDQHFSKAYFDDPTNISFKGKDKERESVPCLDQCMEEEKVGSPVELNVTFKSNALVAKAVVPPSSPAVGSDRNFTPPRNRKIRRITESDSPLTRAVEQSVKSDSSSYGSDCPSSSEKTLKKLAKNYNVCGDGPVWNMNSLPCSTATNGSTRNGAVDSPSVSITDQGGKGKSYDKSRSDRTRKKNKAVLLAADASMQRPTRKDSKPVEGYKYGPSALDEGAMKDVSFASLDGTFVAEMKKPPEDIMQGKDGTVNNTGSPCELDNERNSLSHLASSSGPQVNKIDQIPENTDTLVPYFQFISNSDTIPSEIQSGSTECNIDGTENVNLSPSHLQLLENDNAKVSLESVVTVEGADHDVLPSREEIQFHESPVGLSAVASATFKSPSSFDESSMRQEISSIVDMSSIGSKTFCLNELTTVKPDGVAEGSLNALPANAEEIIAHEDLINLVSLNQDPSITSSFIGGLTNTQAEKIISDTSILGDTGKSAYFDGASELLKNDPAEGSPVDKILTGDSQSVSSSQAYPSDGLDLQLGSSSPRICRTPENVGRPMLDIDATSSYSLKDIAIMEDEVSRSKEENVAAVHAIQEHDSQCTEIDNLKSSSAMEILSPDRSLPSTVVESDILAKDDLLHASNIPSACADVASLSATKAANKHVPVTLIHLVTPETVSTSSDSCTLNNKSLDCMTSGQKLGEYGNELQEKPLSGGGSVVTSSNTSANNFKSNMISSPAKITAVAINTKTALSASQVFNKTTQNLNSGKGVMHVSRNQPIAASGIRRVFTGPSPSVLTNSSTKAPAQQIAKTRTWHRTGKASNFPLPVKKSFSSPVPPPPKRVGMAQSSSYIRTGNTLVRKPTVVTALPSGTPASSSSIFRSSPSGIDEAKKTAGLASKVDVIGAAGSLRTGGLSAPIERPKTPPVLHSSKSSDCIPIDSGDVTSLPLNCPPVDGSGIILNHMLTNHLNVPKMPEEKMNSSGIPERQTSLTCNSESQNILDEGTLEKKIRYVKRKSNQLVAASNSGDPPILDVDKTQASLSDGYYKKRKNQLIRTSAGSHVMQRVASPDDPVYSEMGHAAEVNSSKSLTKKQSNKGKAKIYKHSSFSSVWTLNNQSSRKNGVSLHCQKVWPHLIPWKRAKDWRSFVSMSASASNNSSLSLISQKLLLSRKRDTIYTRSSHGFSLHMSKLLSVGGSSLKWSKSIEKNSKRANEEATLAVAAVEKEKREQNGTSRMVPGSKSRNNISRKSIHSIELHPGERIFRIGLVRYRMDPSRRTLQRISGDEEPSISRQPGKEGKRSYVPRRLLIGHDEYVRIGNGNQLVRDPKKRTRIFANEKVRWSLHTARLRLARKRKYCQFFTRFGKCNKDGGKCPYIHDPSKIAVCTKFLNGSCSDPNCKLTHKVIPERMQDCSYFLQGLCSNEYCPYRHVNVNSNASACEGFLKGYCADGNECRKKHTYVCPIFEATGICPQGSTCKLHHPKKRSGLKRKQQSTEQQQKNARGRYFGSRRNAGVVSEDVAASPGNLGPKDDDDIFSQDGKFSDYIDVDMSDEETDGNCDLTSERRTILADPSYLQVVDINDMIKPIGIMNRNLLTESLLAIDSPSEKSASFLSEESDVCK